MSDEYSFPVQEFEDSFRRAFVDGRANFIEVDGHTLRNKFLREGLNYAEKQGLISCRGPIGTEKQMDEAQYTAYKYYLTEKGKKHFGLAKACGGN